MDIIAFQQKNRQRIDAANRIAETEVDAEMGRALCDELDDAWFAQGVDMFWQGIELAACWSQPHRAGWVWAQEQAQNVPVWQFPEEIEPVPLDGEVPGYEIAAAPYMW